MDSIRFPIKSLHRFWLRNDQEQHGGKAHSDEDFLTFAIKLLFDSDLFARSPCKVVLHLLSQFLEEWILDLDLDLGS